MYNGVRIEPLWFRGAWVAPYMNPSDDTFTSVFNFTDRQARVASFGNPSAVPNAYTSFQRQPQRFNLNLNRVARAHCFDRFTCAPNIPVGLGVHYDCNGTTTPSQNNPSGIGRFVQYYSNPAAEILIYAGGLVLESAQVRRFPSFAIAAWLCDGYFNGRLQIGACCLDQGQMRKASDSRQYLCASGNDGHRGAMMTYTGDIGCGYANTGNGIIVVCNQGGSNRSPYPTDPLATRWNPFYDGAHMFAPPPDDQGYLYM